MDYQVRTNFYQKYSYIDQEIRTEPNGEPRSFKGLKNVNDYQAVQDQKNVTVMCETVRDPASSAKMTVIKIAVVLVFFNNT